MISHSLNKPRVLIACEYSATVRDEFRAIGCDAWSCDFEECEGDSQWHIQGDVIPLLNEKWDLVIAHPPCTYLANSGVSWLHKELSRWNRLDEAAEFFRLFLNAPHKRIAIENPVMHGYAKKRIGGIKQSQIIHPYMFGHYSQKATCLWLKNLPKLIPTNNVIDKMMKLPISDRQRLHYLPPSQDRWKDRSRTFKGIAKAMANQWGPLLFH